MIVTAQRTERDELTTPASVMVLTNKDLVESGATSVYDALKLTSGITAYGFGANGQAWGGMAGKVLIRGNDKGTLVMVDGAPINMNNVYYLNTLPVEAIEKVEVVKGASSVLYGSEAAGGVINIFTRKNMKNSITLSKGEYGKTREGLTLGLGKLGVVANFEQGDELKKMASNGRAMNDGNKNSVMWKYKFDDAWTISHQHTRNDYHFNQYDTATWQTKKENAHYKYDEDFARIQYDAHGWKGNLYYNRSDRDNITHKITGGVAKPNKVENILFQTYGLDLQKSMNTKFADFIVGTTLEVQKYKDTVTYSGGKLMNSLLTEDTKTYALFAQASKDLGNNLILTLGARESWMKANKDYNRFTPEISLLKKFDNNSSVYVNANKAFKMPNFSSLYGSASDVFVPNPYLEPEEGWTYELGYKKVGKSSVFKTALYYIDMDKSWDYEKDKITGDVTPVNASFKNKGFEISYEKHLGDHFSYQLGFDVSNPKSKNKGEWVRRYARQQYTGSLKYHNRNFNSAISVSKTADRAGGWKDKVPVNLFMGYRLDNHSRFDLVCENLLNRKDIVGNWTSATSTEYYSLPRNIRVGYTYTF